MRTVRDENRDKPATKKQTWALFCLTKKDYRQEGLTMQEASELIDKFSKEKGNGKSKKKYPYCRDAEGNTVKVRFYESEQLFNKAVREGQKACDGATPEPMVVAQHANPMDDNSPIEKEWFVPDGPCGFAWINIKAKTPANRKFVSELKKCGLLSSDINSRKVWTKDSYYGGFTYWVHAGNQSIARKEAFARAFVDVLKDAGIDARWMSRLD